MNNIAIKFSNCTYSIDEIDILKNISGQIESNKITTIIGPSGSGKSTLFRLINLLSSTNSGEIYIDGVKISEYNPIDLRIKVGTVLQESIMLEGTVFDNLKLPSDLHGKTFSDQDAIDLLDKVDLETRHLKQNARDLSGGQKQKVSIARTLANKPKILLLDEITASLDQVSRKSIEDLILKLNRDENLTILWITHDIEQAKELGDYTWVMVDGELAYSGPTDKLENASDLRVVEFIRGGGK